MQVNPHRSLCTWQFPRHTATNILLGSRTNTTAWSSLFSLLAKGGKNSGVLGSSVAPVTPKYQSPDAHSARSSQCTRSLVALRLALRGNHAFKLPNTKRALSISCSKAQHTFHGHNDHSRRGSKELQKESLHVSLIGLTREEQLWLQCSSFLWVSKKGSGN